MDAFMYHFVFFHFFILISSIFPIYFFPPLSTSFDKSISKPYVLSFFLSVLPKFLAVCPHPPTFCFILLPRLNLLSLDCQISWCVICTTGASGTCWRWKNTAKRLHRWCRSRNHTHTHTHTHTHVCIYIYIYILCTKSLGPHWFFL